MAWISITSQKSNALGFRPPLLLGCKFHLFCVIGNFFYLFSNIPKLKIYEKETLQLPFGRFSIYSCCSKALFFSTIFRVFLFLNPLFINNLEILSHYCCIQLYIFV